MPQPYPFPCGGQGQPACPPVNSITVLDIVRAYHALSPADREQAERELAAENADTQP